MPIMTWDDSLDVGVAQMNREHQGLLDLMNALYDRAKAGESGPEMIALLDRLATATVEHFAHEEAHMDHIGHAGAEAHKRIHKDLLDKFQRHSEAIKARNGVIEESFFNFMRFWLSAHIRGIDMKYAEKAKSAA